MSHTTVLDPFRLRATMADHWAAYLRENYRNAEEVAVVFGVRFQTALNWWQGANKPSGDVVAHEVMREPQRFATYMRRHA